MENKGICCKASGCVCRYVFSGILLVVSVLLLLTLLNVIPVDSAFGTVVLAWWPVGLAIYALNGFCPCRSECEMCNTRVSMDTDQVVEEGTKEVDEMDDDDDDDN